MPKTDGNRRWSKMFDWNAALGCTRCSPTCSNCASARWLASHKKPGLDSLLEMVVDNGPVATLLGEKRTVPVFNGKVKLRPKELKLPLYLQDDAQVFVCGCSDLFHKDIPDDFIEKIFAVVQARAGIVFFALTRRPERAVEFAKLHDWPDNLWVGVSAETQKLFDYRVSFLAKLPAKYRAVSIKPMMEPINIMQEAGNFELIIVGGQSGMGAQPMHPSWPGMIRDQCKQLQVAFQFHQWGTWGLESTSSDNVSIWVTKDGNVNLDGHGALMYRVGSNIAGCVIDNEEWDQYPDTWR